MNSTSATEKTWRATARDWAQEKAVHLAVGLYCLVGLVFVFLGNVNRDEGWYLYAARLVYHGDIPYRDLPYFQMPVLPYIYGLPQLVFGPSLLVGRLTSFALSLITVGIGVYLCRRLAGRLAAVLFVAFSIVNLNVMWTYTTTRTEPLVAPLVMLSLFFLLKPQRSRRDLVLAPSLMLWATAVRLTAAPAFVAVLALSLYQARKERRYWDSILALVGLQAIVLIVVPFVFSPDRMVFDVWTSQEFRGGQRMPSLPLGVLLRDKALFVSTLSPWFTLMTILVLTLALFLFVRWRAGWRPSIAGLAEWPTAHLLMLGLVALLFLPHLAVEELQRTYFVPAFPVAAVAVATAMQRLFDLTSRQQEWVFLPSLIGVLLLVEAFAFASGFPGYFNTVDPDLFEMDSAARYVQSVVPPGKKVMTFETALALEADRRVVHGLEMGWFGYWPSLETADAERFDVVNRAMLQEIALYEDTGAIAFSGLDMVVMASSVRNLPPAGKEEQPLLYQLLPSCKGEYELAREFEEFGQFGDSLYIFLRAD
jgi:4-amino-4-deoxy-L-arabinose transferase-like glycosyltransferase